MASREPPGGKGDTQFDSGTYGKDVQLLPKGASKTHLASFVQQPGSYTPLGRELLKNRSHKLISQAGMLGFNELSGWLAGDRGGLRAECSVRGCAGGRPA